MAKHEHDWVYGHGSGNRNFSGGCGRACLLIEPVRRGTYVKVLEVLLRYGREVEAREWAAKALDPDYFLGSGEYPAVEGAGPQNEEEFKIWWDGQMERCKPRSGKHGGENP